MSGGTRPVRRWIADPRIGVNGSGSEPYPPQHIHGTFASDQPGVDQRRNGDRPRPQPHEHGPGDAFIDRVLEATRARYPGATVTSCPGYLRVSQPLPGGGAEQWPVGVVNGEVTDQRLQSFVEHVHSQFASADPSVRSELVYEARLPTDELATKALRSGVRLRSFVDYQGLVDLRSLATRQIERLATDPIYPARLYIPQRYRLLDDNQDTTAHDDLLGGVIEWLRADSALFVMVLGDFGRGKTYLLRELARRLPQHQPGLQPVLIELRSLEKAPTPIELLVQHLVRENVDNFDINKLRYMIQSGRLALLIDGFDELELRTGYDNAADYLNVLLSAVIGKAKVILTSRTQHFRSTAQIRTALGDQVASLGTSRVAVLEDFTVAQILRFLTQHYGGDSDRAQARFALLEDVRDLLGLSRNPRMLSFIADLDEQRLRAVQSEHGRISASNLYRKLVDSWLRGETDRPQHVGDLPYLDETNRLAACTTLAIRLWATTALTIPLAEFTARVADTLTRLAELQYTVEEATHAVGSGSLLVRTPEGEFTFVHQSVMEWLVANSAAESLQNGRVADTLFSRKMSTLMRDFLCDLAGHEVARGWAAKVLADPEATQVVKQNGLAVTLRLGPGGDQILVGVDLRGLDLTRCDLRNAKLRGANLSGMRLVETDFSGADLRDANLMGIRMQGGSLAGARIAGSRWDRAALLEVSGLDDLTAAPEFVAVAVAVAGQDRADVMIAPTGNVSSVAFSPNGSLLALSRGPSVEIVDVASSHPLRVLTGHTGEVTGVAFSPDGTLLATASADGTARLWDPTTGEHRTTLTGHTDWVRAVAFSPDATLLATASDDRTIRLWDPTTGDHRTTLTGHTGWVRGVAFSPDATLLATASADGTARLWDPTTGQHHTTLTGHTGWVRAVAFSPDGTLLATASRDGTARLWDPTTGALRATLLALDRGDYAVFLPDGSYKLKGDPGRALWWAIKLCRFAPGELDPYDPAVWRLPADAPFAR
jgi:hypothetical protein